MVVGKTGTYKLPSISDPEGSTVKTSILAPLPTFINLVGTTFTFNPDFSVAKQDITVGISLFD